MTRGFPMLFLMPFLACSWGSTPRLSGDVPFPSNADLGGPEAPVATDVQDAALPDVPATGDVKDAVLADTPDLAVPDPGLPDLTVPDTSEDLPDVADPGSGEDLAPDPGPPDEGLPDPGPDVVPPECEPGASRTVACGFNGNGTQAQGCANGKWHDQGPCDDPDACINGATQSFQCGLNGRGTREDLCTGGQWVPGTCSDPDACVDGTSQTVPCGPDGGSKAQACVAGQWQDAGGCVTPPGRWDCQDNVCTQVPGAAGCGDGKCEPKKGESKQSCPGDCDFSGQAGEGKPCGDAYDCAFYNWPAGGVGYWDCAGWPWDRKCKAIHDKTYCGTEGQDYCYMTGQYLETDSSCPADCKKKFYNCGSDMECIFLEWK
jgi:hypothetical protein